ncbi:MAG: hypothetical protein GY953_55455 [bacterium]|nr:hypothetical protein [bacterium]
MNSLYLAVGEDQRGAAVLFDLAPLPGNAHDSRVGMTVDSKQEVVQLAGEQMAE